MRKKRKTINEVTIEEWAALAAASEELLGAARLMFWLSGIDQRKDGDTSERDSIDRTAAALEAIGLPQGTTAEFITNIEAMMKSGLSPSEWRKSNDISNREKQRPRSQNPGTTRRQDGTT